MMPPGQLEFGGAILLGLFGAGHCIAMCGGIMTAVGLRAAPAGGGMSRARPLAQTALYSAGRVGSYMALGAAVGAVGAALTEMLADALMLLRTVAGLLLIAMGAYVAGFGAGLWRGLAALEAIGGGPWRTVLQLRARVPHALEPLVLGVAWGLLPCGLVYGALAWTAATADPLRAALLMLGFGMGTLPAVAGGTLFAGALRPWLARPGVRRIAGGLIAALGLWTLASAQLHAMPAQHAHHGNRGSDACAIDAPQGPGRQPAHTHHS